MKVVVLTGAGISAESGLQTFRDSNGLWEGHRPEDVATPEAFAANRTLVQTFYDQRRAAAQRARPNPAHVALAALERGLGSDLFLVTQNVDDLHERAGSGRVHHMHGELAKALCELCGSRVPWSGRLVDEPTCGRCGARSLRPDIVWFGEMPYGMDEIHEALHSCDMFAAIGTSGVVYPAAAFVDYADGRGARTIELNLERGRNSEFHESRIGPASRVVPEWVDDIIASL